VVVVVDADADERPLCSSVSVYDNVSVSDNVNDNVNDNVDDDDVDDDGNE
jgi:hypothetical protein